MENDGTLKASMGSDKTEAHMSEALTNNNDNTGVPSYCSHYRDLIDGEVNNGKNNISVEYMVVTRYLQENKDEYDSQGPIHDFLRVDYTPKETTLILVDINVLFLIETKKYVEEMKRIQDDLHYP